MWRRLKDIFTNHELVKELINPEAVCRTAPATPGLVKISVNCGSLDFPIQYSCVFGRLVDWLVGRWSAVDCNDGLTVMLNWPSKNAQGTKTEMLPRLKCHQDTANCKALSLY